VIWATRTGVHVDRAASAWLIRRFIDPEATFIFVDDPADVPPGATPFDMRGAGLSHHADDCTFETMLKRDDLADPVVSDIAHSCTRRFLGRTFRRTGGCGSGRAPPGALDGSRRRGGPWGSPDRSSTACMSIERGATLLGREPS
jgi:hypothetical protein